MTSLDAELIVNAEVIPRNNFRVNYFLCVQTPYILLCTELYKTDSVS